MKVIFSILFVTAFTLHLSIATAQITDDAMLGTQVVPNAYSGTAGTGTFLGPLANAQRTYQLLIQSSQLTALVGKNLTGLNMRIPGSATANWPLADVTYTNYDIYLSGSVEPSARSLTFANNIVGPQTLVRSGSLIIQANSYTFGGNPNAFGTEIIFNTPWQYSGGNVLIEIRHSGFSGTSRSTDALTTSTSGYLSQFSACWTGSYTGTAGVQGNFTILNLNASEPLVLQLTSLIEGLYDDGTNSMVSDTAKVFLRKDFFPFDIVDSSKGILDANGNGSFSFSNASNGVNYYIVVDQRNSVNTWSASGNMFTGGSLNYDFTTAASTAYENNLKLEGARWTVYSGDVNKDGFIDLTDLIMSANDASSFVTGYVATDVNGDLQTDLLDIVIIYNNSSAFVEEKSPL